MTRALGTPHRGQITVVAVVLLAMIVLRTLDSRPGQRVRGGAAGAPVALTAKGSIALSEALDQAGQVGRHGRLEPHATIVDRMAKRQTTGVQGLARERNRSRAV